MCVDVRAMCADLLSRGQRHRWLANGCGDWWLVRREETQRFSEGSLKAVPKESKY